MYACFRLPASFRCPLRVAALHLQTGQIVRYFKLSLQLCLDGGCLVQNINGALGYYVQLVPESRRYAAHLLAYLGLQVRAVS